MKRITRLLGVLGALAAIGACSTQPYRAVVKGRVVEQSDHSVVVDLGSSDHVATGDKLLIYRQTLVGNAKQIPYYADTASGEIRVDEILKSHSARATVINGSASKGELVELRQVQ